MSVDHGQSAVLLWENLTATLAQIADRNLPGWDAGEMAAAAKTVVERSQWLADQIAAERERIAQAIEAVAAKDRTGMSLAPSVTTRRVAGMQHAARIARSMANP